MDEDEFIQVVAQQQVAVRQIGLIALRDLQMALFEGDYDQVETTAEELDDFLCHGGPRPTPFILWANLDQLEENDAEAHRALTLLCKRHRLPCRILAQA